MHLNFKAYSLLEGETQGSELSRVTARVSFMVNINRNNLWSESSRRLWDVHELREEAGALRVSTGVPVDGHPELETELSTDPAERQCQQHEEWERVSLWPMRSGQWWRDTQCHRGQMSQQRDRGRGVAAESVHR